MSHAPPTDPAFGGGEPALWLTGLEVG